MGHAHGAATGKIVRRLKILEGQIRGLQDMIEKDTYCVDVITQTSAVKQGLSNIENMILENHLSTFVVNQIHNKYFKKIENMILKNHLSTCVVKQIQGGDSKKAVGEVLKVYKLKRK